jgi:hypothetical protein
MRTLPIVLLAAAATAAAATATAAPTGTPPYVPPAGTTCAPSGAWVTTSRGEFWLSPGGGTCETLLPDGTLAVTSAASPRVSASTPRLILKRGETVTVAFVAPPQRVVVLTTYGSPRATSGRTYRLSPFTTTWRARPGSGLLEFTTTQRFASPTGAVTDTFVGYSAVYRTVR